MSAGLKGASVTVLEKAPLIGGTTSWGGGGIWIPANPWAAAEGHPDTESEALTYLRHLNLGDADLDLAQRYVSQAAGVVQSVERHTPLRWNTIQNFPDYHAELPVGKAEGGRSLEIDSLEVGLDILREMRPNPYGAIAASRRELMAGIDATELQRRTERGIVGKGVGVISAMCLTARSMGARMLAGRRGRPAPDARWRGHRRGVRRRRIPRTGRHCHRRLRARSGARARVSARTDDRTGQSADQSR